MKTMCECASKGPKLKSLFKKAFKFGFYSLELNNYTHKACALLNTNPKFSMIHTTIDFRKLMPMLVKNMEVSYDKQVCGFYENKKYHDEWITVKILTEMEKKNIIFIVFNIFNYLFDGYDYAHHCTTGIFYPCGEDYNFFYLNPHGKDSIQDDGYIDRITQFREKKIKAVVSRDILFVRSFLTNIQNVLNKYEWKLNLFFDQTKNHNYYGPNLQSGDAHGICFTFPLIIWHYMIQDTTKFLQEKKLMEFMLHCHCVFDSKLEKAFEAFFNLKKKYMLRHVKYHTTITEEEIDFYKRHQKSTQLTYEEFYFIKSVEDILKKRGTYFIKRVVTAIITFLTQKPVREKTKFKKN